MSALDTLRFTGQALRSLPTEVPKMLTAWVDSFVRNAHAPVEIDGQVYCTNHWRPRVQPWPCDDLLRHERRTAWPTTRPRRSRPAPRARGNGRGAGRQ